MGVFGPRMQDCGTDKSRKEIKVAGVSIYLVANPRGFLRERCQASASPTLMNRIPFAMRGFANIVLALVGTAAAQTTTVIEVVNPFFGNNPYDASVVDANPTATTYAVYCQKNSTSYQCRDDPAGLTMTLVGGPSTVEVHVERPKSELYVGSGSWQAAPRTQHHPQPLKELEMSATGLINVS
ncbi:hypothetical protein LZ30DRAFT_697422 [Colletotrichum cereale]|nr:hypothetical protein LZ30DRAFT_697422 [Colletotrichum cereale]